MAIQKYGIVSKNMARAFTTAEKVAGDCVFDLLERIAQAASLDLEGDGQSTRWAGQVHTRTVSGGFAARAGFPAEAAADESFLSDLAAKAPGDVLNRGIYLARHASGLLIISANHYVDSPSGDASYDYDLRTLRTAEHPDMVISGRAVGRLALNGDGDLFNVEHTYAERLRTPDDFFRVDFDLTAIEQVMRNVASANQG